MIQYEPIQEYQPNDENQKRLSLAQEISQSIDIEHSAYVFGSTARETAGPNSDLDQIIVINSFEELSQINSPFLPRLAHDELISLPPNVTNISINTEANGIKVHLEIYTKYWLEKLLTATTTSKHNTAIYDPDHQQNKKPYGTEITLQNTSLTHNREISRIGPFYIMNDFEPSRASSTTALRIEQRKLACCIPITDRCKIQPAIDLNQGNLYLQIEKLTGRRPELSDFYHTFYRLNDEQNIVPLSFTPESSKKTLSHLEQSALKIKTPETLRDIPQSIRIATTDACNLRCVYCMGEGNSPLTAREGQHMNIDTFSGLIDAWIKCGGKKVKYTGGEPFLNRDLAKMFEISHQRGLSQSITTNGYYLTEKNIAILEKYHVGLIVSLDTMVANAISKMSPVGAPSEFILRRVEDCINAGLEVEINTVLTTYSKDCILETMMPWVINHQIPLRILEEGTVIEGNQSGNFLSIDDLAREIAEKYNLTVQNRNKYNDLIITDQQGHIVAYLLRSFCGNKDAESCIENSLRIDSLGQAVPCMKSGIRIPLQSTGEAITTQERMLHALSFQQSCST